MGSRQNFEGHEGFLGGVGRVWGARPREKWEVGARTWDHHHLLNEEQLTVRHLQLAQSRAVHIIRHPRRSNCSWI